jgi:hypothetical protein
VAVAALDDDLLIAAVMIHVVVVVSAAPLDDDLLGRSRRNQMPTAPNPTKLARITNVFFIFSVSV